MSERLCAVDGCERPVSNKKRSLCNAHYQRWRTTGDVRADVPLGTPRPKGSDPSVCSVEGCGRDVVARGVCSGHYAKLRKESITELCSVAGCGRTANSSRKYCGKHYQRWLKYGDPEQLAIKPARTASPACAIAGCTAVRPRGRWLCGKHHRYWLSLGDPPSRRTYRKTCAHQGCSAIPRVGDTCATHKVCVYGGCDNGNVRASGYCNTHQTRIDKYGSPDARQNPRFLPFVHLLTEEKVRRVASRLDYDGPNGCWVTTTGTERTRVNLGQQGGVYVYARSYQVIWAWHNGRDPSGSIDHLCRNPRCCRPDHLEDVSDRENSWRHHAAIKG